MRSLVLFLFVVGLLSLSGCVASLKSEPRQAKCDTGFWFWNGSSREASPAVGTLDVLFVQVGTIYKQTPMRLGKEPWSVNGELPGDLPPAREYWFVYRFEHQQVPDLTAAPIVAREFSRVREAARQRQLNVAGIQLDIDSPTSALPRYASFLREVRKSLPTGVEISITALLDWFRDGTSIAEVIKQTDEFVPQFYDIAEANYFDPGGAIAAKFDSTRWAPKFNRFQKRFRIGISSFGRASYRPVDSPEQRYVALFRDLTPLDVAPNPDFRLETRLTDANELKLNYRAARATKIGDNRFRPGDAIQFILPIPDAIRTAAESAKRIHGYCAGIVFFRWPASNEDLAMQPSDVLAAAGLSAREPERPAAVHLVDGGCVAVKCMDVYLINAKVLSQTPVRYHIRSSRELEYFLPEARVPVTMSGPSELTLSLPPYCGRGSLYLGRAVTAATAKYSVEAEQ